MDLFEEIQINSEYKTFFFFLSTECDIVIDIAEYWMV